MFKFAYLEFSSIRLQIGRIGKVKFFLAESVIYAARGNNEKNLFFKEYSER